MTRIVFAAALVLVLGCTGEKAQYPNPTPSAQPTAAPAQPTAAAPSAAPAPAEGAAAPGAAAAPAAPAAPAVEITPAARAEADQVFATVCFTCHGASGAGDGPASAGFPVKPRNFSDPAWQASVTDEHIEKVILQGGPAVGKSPLMPPNPTLDGKPAVLAALREKIRGFGKK